MADSGWRWPDGAPVVDDSRARALCDDVMARHGFRDDVRRLLLRRSIFTCADLDSTNGGGGAHFGYNGQLNWVELLTAQTEAAVHECAHVGWYEMEVIDAAVKEECVQDLCTEFARQADLPHGRYKTVRELCHVYKYGDGKGFDGMWLEDQGRW